MFSRLNSPNIQEHPSQGLCAKIGVSNVSSIRFPQLLANKGVTEIDDTTRKMSDVSSIFRPLF